MKTCKACDLEKAETEFHKDRAKSDGLAPYCKPCLIAKQREYEAHQAAAIEFARLGLSVESEQANFATAIVSRYLSSA